MPLVSIIVITYNSSKTILDTLDSLKHQTYQNLELIVSDDGSKDSTVSICKKWIEDNKQRLVNAKVITTDCNTGTAGNCNRGCRAASGEWIKIIAGDDLMINDGIEKLVKFAVSDDTYEIVSGKVEIFGVKSANYDDNVWNFNQKLHRVFDTASEQHWYLVRRNFLAAMAVMMKKSLWEKVGGFDEDIPLLEDWPMWIKVTEAGVMIHFFDEPVARYRLTSGSVRANNGFLYSVRLFQYKYVYHEMGKFHLLQKMEFLKNRNIISSILHRIISRDINHHNMQL
jgi:Predicted glycosyltransferases